MSSKCFLALVSFVLLFEWHDPVSAATEICSRIPPLAEPFTVNQWLEALRKNGNVTKVEEALCLIPEKVRGNFLLVNASQSAQSGTKENPRAILFDPGKDTEPIKYAISFNGNSKQNGGDKMEVIMFDVTKPADRQMEFIDVDFKGSRPHVSDPNPELCLSCHQFNTTIPRPLWDAKKFFPTAFGRTTLGGGPAVSKTEAKELESFIKTAKSHPRYSFLHNLKSVFDFFCSPKNIEKGNCEQSSKILAERNETFASRLDILNRRRVAELIRRSTDFDKYKFSILAAFKTCPNISEYLPPKIRQKHEGKYGLSEPLTKEPITQASLNKAHEIMNGIFDCKDCAAPSLESLKKKAADDGIDSAVFPYFADLNPRIVQWPGIPMGRVAPLRYLFEGRGISMAAWNMDIFQALGSYRFQNGPGDNMALDLPLIMWELFKDDPDLKNMVPSWDGKNIEDFISKVGPLFPLGEKRPVCDELKQKSLAAFAVTKTQSPPKAKAGRR